MTRIKTASKEASLPLTTGCELAGESVVGSAVDLSLDRNLDAALAMTFPASDPVAIDPQRPSPSEINPSGISSEPNGPRR